MTSKPTVSSMTRRRFGQRALAGGAATLFMPALMARAASDTLVVNSQGGEYQELFERTVIRPFEAKFGAKVVHDPTGIASQDYAKVRASGGAPGFDVAAVVTAVELNLGGREGLWEPITEAEAPNLAHMWGQTKALLPYGVCHSVQYATLLHLKDKIDAPESWMDYWNPRAKYGDAIAGRMLTFQPSSLLALFALVAGAEARGGGMDNMEPAWENLKTLKPDVATVQTSIAQAIQFLEREQVYMMPSWSARAFYYQKAGMPIGVTVPKEGTMAFAECAAIPIGAENKVLAKEFVNFMLDPEIQFNYCNAYHISPGRPDITGWSEEFMAQQVTTEDKIKTLRFADMTRIAESTRDWTLRWQEVMGV